MACKIKRKMNLEVVLTLFRSAKQGQKVNT